MRWTLPTLSLALVLGLTLQVVVDADEAFFRQKVLPVLQRRCLECHNGLKSRGGLDVTTRATLLQGGESGPGLVPGQSGKSLLVQQVSGAKPAMPRQGPPLNEQEVADLKKWIDGGAAWPQSVKLGEPGKKAADRNLWSLQPLKRPPVPAVKNNDWCQTPIDAFILAKLEEKGLQPSPEADPRTLIRRLTYDLHGLPPTPEEIEAFVKAASPPPSPTRGEGERDPTPQPPPRSGEGEQKVPSPPTPLPQGARGGKRQAAIEQLVDHLLAAPRYGERWGRHWLDVVHYADTHGYDKDHRRDHAWPYRDYVIRAFNEDKPYPQFIREQVAGDVLYPGNPDALIATGFIAAGPWDLVGHVELREGTVDKARTKLLDRDDMLSNTMSTFVSLTVHCARCHDHKFDPIAQKDYYRLQAVFAGLERGNRTYLDRDAVERKQVLEKRRQELLAQQALVQQKIDAVSSPELVQVYGQVQRWREELAALPAAKGSAPSPSNGWHSGIEKTPDVTKWVQVDLGEARALDEVRLLPARPTDFQDTPGFGFPVRFQIEVSNDAKFQHSEVVADHTLSDYPNPKENAFRLRLEGRKARHVRVTATKLWKRLNDYCFALAELQVLAEGQNVALGRPITSLDSIEAGRWSRKYLVDDHDSRTTLPDRTTPAVRQREQLEDRIAAAESRRQKTLAGLLDPPTKAAIARLTAALKDVQQGLTEVGQPKQVYAVLPIKPRPIHLLTRGDVTKPREAVGPGALACVSGLPFEFPVPDPNSEGQRRAALAEWLASKDNPLPWRSSANRVWHYHFGRGLVDTPNDFGRNGSAPTHPELLDWLACEIRDKGGSLKKLHRLIVTSATYRQSSGRAGGVSPLRNAPSENSVVPQGAHAPRSPESIDADNRFLWRMPRARLDAESIRDSVLAVSGKLDLAMGGPGFEVFRFKYDHSPVYDHSALEKIHDPKTYRRTIYRFTVRSVPNPFLDCLDGADPNVNTPVRNTTLTALQALALLNDPFMVKQAEFFAARLQREKKLLSEQVDLAVRLCFGRAAERAERGELTAFAQRFGLARLCRVLFNANEFVFVD